MAQDILSEGKQFQIQQNGVPLTPVMSSEEANKWLSNYPDAQVEVTDGTILLDPTYVIGQGNPQWAPGSRILLGELPKEEFPLFKWMYDAGIKPPSWWYTDSNPNYNRYMRDVINYEHWHPRENFFLTGGLGLWLSPTYWTGVAKKYYDGTNWQGIGNELFLPNRGLGEFYPKWADKHPLLNAAINLGADFAIPYVASKTIGGVLKGASNYYLRHAPMKPDYPVFIDPATLLPKVRQIGIRESFGSLDRLGGGEAVDFNPLFTLEPSLYDYLGNSPYIRGGAFYRGNPAIRIGNHSYVLEDLYNGKVNLNEVLENGITANLGEFDLSNLFESKFPKEHKIYAGSLEPLQRDIYLSNGEVPKSLSLAVDNVLSKKLSSRKTLAYYDHFRNRVTDWHNELGIDPSSRFINDLFRNSIKSLSNFAKSRKLKMEVSKPRWLGEASVADPTIGFNRHKLHQYAVDQIEHIINHEASHLEYNLPRRESGDLSRPSLPEVINSDLMGNPADYVNDLAKNLLKEDFDYLTSKDEIKARLTPAVEEMLENGWTPELTYDLSKLLNLDPFMKTYFKKDYVIKLLAGLLSVMPIVKSND